MLKHFLSALDATDAAYHKTKVFQFCSATTMEALRMTLNGIIALVDDLLNDNYSFVLTGKFSQDCIEVNNVLVRGSVRSSMGSARSISAESF